jgi:hypothetical protein
MSMSNKGRWVKRLGIGALALLGLGAVTFQSTPADARVFFDIGFPAYGYVAPPLYYGYAYPTYYMPYYGYPYYGGGGAFIGFGDGHHHWR